MPLHPTRSATDIYSISEMHQRLPHKDRPRTHFYFLGDFFLTFHTQSCHLALFISESSRWDSSARGSTYSRQLLPRSSVHSCKVL